MHMKVSYLAAMAFASNVATAARIYDNPECNQVRFQAGCLLDVLEKVCESVKDLQRCAVNPESCRNQEEFPGLVRPAI